LLQYDNGLNAVGRNFRPALATCQADILEMQMASTLAEKVLKHATGLPEGAPMAAKKLLNLGNQAAVDQVLSRLTRRGRLLRAGRGIDVFSVAGRFGTRPPGDGQSGGRTRGPARRNHRDPRLRRGQ
jgi:hypothetical protein